MGRHHSPTAGTIRADDTDDHAETWYDADEGRLLVEDAFRHDARQPGDDPAYGDDTWLRGDDTWLRGDDTWLRGDDPRTGQDRRPARAVAFDAVPFDAHGSWSDQDVTGPYPARAALRPYEVDLLADGPDELPDDPDTSWVPRSEDSRSRSSTIALLTSLALILGTLSVVSIAATTDPTSSARTVTPPAPAEAPGTAAQRASRAGRSDAAGRGRSGSTTTSAAPGSTTPEGTTTGSATGGATPGGTAPEGTTTNGTTTTGTAGGATAGSTAPSGASAPPAGTGGATGTGSPASASSTTSRTTASTGTAASTGTPGLLTTASGAISGVLMSASELADRPTSGSGWSNVTAAARALSGPADLADQNSTHAARTLAAALVHARTGDAAHRAKVVAVLRDLPDASLSGARVLGLGRQLAGYVLAADLVGHREQRFVAWVGAMRTKDIGNHGRWTTITGTSEDSGSNWGAWAMASRVAMSAFLGDRTDLARAATVFRGFTGERSAYAGFRKTSDFDPAWACGENWVPINPAGCGDRDGAVVEDISRSEGSAPSVDSTGLTYSWEVLGGATLSARLLERAGYADVWQWGDRALLRAARFLERNGGYAPQYRVNQYIPHEINAAYGVRLGPVGSPSYGRQFGFTDWLG